MAGPRTLHVAGGGQLADQVLAGLHRLPRAGHLRQARHRLADLVAQVLHLADLCRRSALLSTLARRQLGIQQQLVPPAAYAAPEGTLPKQSVHCPGARLQPGRRKGI